jgi:hypothetical protein
VRTIHFSSCLQRHRAPILKSEVSKIFTTCPGRTLLRLTPGPRAEFDQIRKLLTAERPRADRPIGAGYPESARRSHRPISGPVPPLSNRSGVCRLRVNCSLSGRSSVTSVAGGRADENFWRADHRSASVVRRGRNSRTNILDTRLFTMYVHFKFYFGRWERLVLVSGTAADVGF